MVGSRVECNPSLFFVSGVSMLFNPLVSEVLLRRFDYISSWLQNVTVGRWILWILRAIHISYI